MWWIFKTLLLSFSILSNTICSRPIIENKLEEPYKLPLVVLHGLESSSLKMVPFCQWLVREFNTPVYNIEIGNGEKTSIYTSLNKQLEELCKTIYELDDELSEGFNFLGMSQGGLLARGYVERCNFYPVHNLITFVAPHGGEFIEDLDNYGYMYTTFFQKHFSISNYWRNPLDLNSYFMKCVYLPLLNNEIQHNNSQEQTENIKSLMNFVMIWSPNDAVLKPPESGKFGTFNQEMKVIELYETDLYKNDLLGLKYLYEQQRLHIRATNCSHVDHRNPNCYSQIYNILKDFI